MILPEQVKHFILHDDIRVANRALEYFEKSYLYDTDLMPLFLERLKNLKKGEQLYLHKAYRFPQTKESLTEIMDLVEDPKLDQQTKIHLCTIFSEADPLLLEPLLPELPGLLSKARQLIESRTDIIRWSNQELWDAFNDYLKQACGKYYNEIQLPYGEALIREIARRRLVSEDFILNALDSYNPDDVNGYETIFYTKLAGEMKLEAAVPLVNKFMTIEEDEILSEVSSSVLIRIGTETVVQQVEEEFIRQSEGYYRLYASDIFGNIKLPASEMALLRLLEQEEDLTIATKLADGLCALGSTVGIYAVHKLVREGYDSGYMDLRESLYINCIINDVQLPELGDWKQDLDAKESDLRKRMNQFFPGTTVTSVRTEAKVGRNDPCPCGSGKKYKKCCAS